MKIKVVASTHKSASNINHLVGKVFEAKKTADSSRVEIIDGNEVIPLFEGEWEEVKLLIKVPKVDGVNIPALEPEQIIIGNLQESFRTTA